MGSIENLTIGSVFLLFDDLAVPPKHKRCIVVGVTSDKSEFATVYINTGVNMRFINSPELEALQIEIVPSLERPYIDHTSFIDCSEIKQRFPVSFIENVRNGGRRLGSLCPEDLKAVLDCLHNADSISSYYKRLYNIRIL